jgi:hypothetical protein
VKEENMKEFKPDFGFAIPNRTKKECPSPEFSDHKLHRVAIMKLEHFGSVGDRDEGGIPGWATKGVCVGCGKTFKHITGFYIDT